MIQKTVRFYDAPDDSKALEIINNYRQYGFNSCREMIIASIIAYTQKDNSSSGDSVIDIEALAEKIVSRLNLNITTVGITNSSEYKEENNERSNEENYNKALSFMESL